MEPVEEHSLTANIPLTRICGQRDEAIRLMAEAIALMEKGYALADQAKSIAEQASSGAVFNIINHAGHADYTRLFQTIDKTRSADAFRHHVDACVWLHLMRVTGIEHLMDATAKEEFFAQLCGDVPAVNEDTVRATFEGLRGDAGLIFRRGLARAFSDLDRRFRSHDGFKIGSRIILTSVFDEWGSWNYYSTARATIQDIERVFAILDGEQPQPGELEAVVKESRGGGFSRRQGVAESRYFRIRTFKNGNAHLWFTRDDLVERANLMLADYYGAVIPDAAPHDVDPLRQTSGLPAKNLSYYPTPRAVVDLLLHDLHIPDGGRVLEPSAGTGNIVRALLERGYAVDAIEIDQGRMSELSRLTGLGLRSALHGNFLRLTPRPLYDAVVMNPPFYGTHWMEHVTRAMGWLVPGGVLRTVLPVTAETGDSRKHRAFRAWATRHTRWNNSLRWVDLPVESFAESGTRINTVLLTLYKARE